MNEQKISFNVIPVDEPQISRSQKLLPVSFPTSFIIANLVEQDYVFDHKIKLIIQSNEVAHLQVLSKGLDGNVNHALVQNQFPLNGDGLRLTFIDTRGDRSQYQIELSAVENTTYENQTFLSGDYEPGLDFALVVYESDIKETFYLSFIGSIDIRARTARGLRWLMEAGNWVDLKWHENTLIFKN